MLNIFLLSLSAMLSSAGKPSVDLVFAGDAMQHEVQLKSARQADGTYDYSQYYTAIEPYIASADYAVVNLETPLGGAPYSGYPMFCAPDSYLTALKNAGFDLILTANNHALDRRDRGVRRTVETIEQAGLPWVGTYRDAGQRAEVLPRIVDIGGFKVAFLNYTYGTNGIEIQGDVVVDRIDRDLIAQDIEAARAKGAEIIAVALHWGDEYHLLPNKKQKALADYLTDIGVDLIIGGHPHVIQPMEIRHSDKHDKDVFLCYSLGNFISGMRTTDTRGGVLARIRLKRTAEGRAIVDSASYLPVFTLFPDQESKNFRLKPAADEAPGTSLEQQRKAFKRNADRIFSTHNINVPADTVTMADYAKRLQIMEKVASATR